MLGVVGNGVQADVTMLAPAVYCGEDTTHKTLETMFNARAWLQQCENAVKMGPTLLRYAWAITEQKKCWELLGQNFDWF